jgi:hypothetical protein
VRRPRNVTKKKVELHFVQFFDQYFSAGIFAGNAVNMVIASGYTGETIGNFFPSGVSEVVGVRIPRLVLREDAAHADVLHGERPRKGVPQILRIDSFPISGAIGLFGRSDKST